jgi:hypothetical protein
MDSTNSKIRPTQIFQKSFELRMLHFLSPLGVLFLLPTTNPEFHMKGVKSAPPLLFGPRLSICILIKARQVVSNPLKKLPIFGAKADDFS